MKRLRCEATTTPTEQVIAFLTARINEDGAGHGQAYPFAILARDESETVIAGCSGSVIFGSIYTDQLWVHAAHRGKGIGTNLMEQVHELGRGRGCQLATLTIMSFQAPDFYKKLGYEVDFSRGGYDKNALCVFMSKRL